MSENRKEERLLVMFAFTSMTRGHELLKKLKEKLDALDVLEFFNLELRRFRTKELASKGISELRPVLVIIQLDQFKEPDGGFIMLEQCLETVSGDFPFFSIIYGRGIDPHRKHRSQEFHKKDPFHLGTCSSQTKNDNMLLDKIVGVLVQDPIYSRFQHLETATGSKGQQIVNGLLESIDPIKEALEDFSKGNEDCFYGIERTLVNLDKEMLRLRAYYDELYGLFAKKRLIVIPDPTLLEALKQISLYLNDRKSPLVQLMIWMKTIDREISTSADICNFLERRIGDYQISGFWTVFNDRYTEFRDNLQKILTFIDSK